MEFHDHPHRVTYSETDQMGYVYYANHLAWFEIGRTELIRATGLAYSEIEDMGYVLPVMEARCKYMIPAKYDDLITIRTRVTTFRGARIEFAYEIIRDGETLATGMTTHAFVDKDGRPKKPPEGLKERIDRAFRA